MSDDDSAAKISRPLIGHTDNEATLLGISHYHIIANRVVEQWDVFDEMAMLTQIKLGAMRA